MSGGKGSSAKVPVVAVLRAARVLDVISHLGSGGVREVARRIDADPSTVHRTLLTLEQADFLIRDPRDGTFAISPRLGRLAQRGVSNYALLRVAGPHLSDLQRRIGKTVLLAVPDDTDLVYIERFPKGPLRADPAGGVQIASGPGYRVPLHATGAGKAYLAALSPDARKELLDRTGLPRLTRTTITDREVLHRQLAQVARRGWALNDEEYRAGARGVGVCIQSAAGPVACISVTGSVESMPDDYVEELGSLVVAVAQRISREQGFHPAGNELGGTAHV